MIMFPKAEFQLFVHSLVNDLMIESAIFEGYSTIFESPIAYDEETRELPKKDSKWGFLPPTHATAQEVQDWVISAANDGIITLEVIGSGIDKKVLMNDGKTVFKFSHNNSDEQIYTESNIYKKYGKKYPMLAKIYKAGDHWMIQEYAVQFNSPSDFADMIGLAKAGLGYKDWHDMFYVGNRITTDWGEIKPKLSLDNAEAMIAIQYPNITEECPNFVKLARVPFFSELADFCVDAGVTLTDMTYRQFGHDGHRVVLFDYGMLIE